MNTAPQLSSIGKYRLIASIGQGGMSHIHLALMAGPAGFNKLLVIKALREDLGQGSEELVTMFLDEARLAARLNHANIVQTYEVGEANGRYFIAMEYLEGQSLKTVERRIGHGALPLNARLRILSEIAKGLHHAHELRGFSGEQLGVVHRDVSPQNVFITYDGQVKLLDFGIAKASNALHMTKVGVIKGKADYIAPEQIRGENVDRRADVFSLGVMLWESLTARRFAGGPDVSDVTKMHNRLTSGEMRIREANPEVPERLAQICERAIALYPESRHATALDFAQDLDDYLADASLYPNAQQLAQLVAPAFAKEREQLHRLIEEQTKQALDPRTTFDASTGALPVLPLPRLTQHSGVWMLPQTGGSQSLTPSGIVVTQEGMVSARPLYQTQPIPLSTAAPAPQRTAPWPLVIALVVVSVSVATFFGTREPARSAEPESTPIAVAPPPAKEPVQGATVEAEKPAGPVNLRLVVEPSSAEVRLDGAIIQVPFNAEVARDTKLHELVIAADGYETHREMLTFDRDQSMTIMLDRAADEIARKRVTARGPAPAVTSESPVQAPAEPVNQAEVSKARTPDKLEPGMDFRRINSGKPAVQPDVALEEDPYR